MSMYNHHVNSVMMCIMARVVGGDETVYGINDAYDYVLSQCDYPLPMAQKRVGLDLAIDELVPEYVKF